jgi:hypothetical protein
VTIAAFLHDLSSGCAFVTYDNADSAELAIETLHNKQTLPGMTSPIQVKYAHGGGGGGGDQPRYTPGTEILILIATPICLRVRQSVRSLESCHISTRA